MGFVVPVVRAEKRARTTGYCPFTPPAWQKRPNSRRGLWPAFVPLLLRAVALGPVALRTMALGTIALRPVTLGAVARRDGSQNARCDTLFEFFQLKIQVSHLLSPPFRSTNWPKESFTSAQKKRPRRNPGPVTTEMFGLTDAASECGTWFYRIYRYRHGR